MNPENHVFISYSWEGSLAPKRWLSRVAEQLSWHGFQVFLDRECIEFGSDINAVIDARLAERPLVIFCMCDAAYCDAAKTPGTGVFAEVQAISRIQDTPGVRVVPILLEPHSRIGSLLPPLLAGRLSIAMSAVKDLDLSIAGPLLTLLCGGTQATVQGKVDEIVTTTDLRQRLSKTIEAAFTTVRGSPRNHRVDGDGEDLNVGAELARHKDFEYYLSSNSESGHVLWYWSGCGTGASILGAAIVGHCFPAAAQGDSADLFAAGRLLAVSVFRFIREHEPFCMSPEHVVSALTLDVHGRELAERLLATVPT